MKTVLVTGASGGIGGAISRLFARYGYKVGVNYNNNKDVAERLANEIGGEAIKFDVSDGSATENAVKDFINRYGRIDALINNAGVALGIKPIIDVSEEEFDFAFGVNVKGVYNTVKAVLPHMIGRGGSIVNVSSMWGISGGSCEAVYSATKAAVIGFTKALAKEYANSGVRINAVAPGLIDTAMNDNLSNSDKTLAIGDIPLGRIGKPEEVAEAVFFLTEKATFTTGEVLNLSGGEII